jgi:hypothetical protein
VEILTKIWGMLGGGVEDVLNKEITDKNLVARLKAGLQLAVLSADTSALGDQASIIEAEAKSESWLTCNWRPLTMMVFVSIIAFNFIIGPVLRMFHVPVGDLPTPPDLWDLLKLGIGGYVAGRSIEKAAAAWKGTP